MKITTIPNIYRNLSRAGDVVSVLSKYGLADWISRLDIDFAKKIFKHPSGELLAQHTRETRIRLALTELGPTYIKLGQVLSTRPDLIGVALATELQHLQSDVPADSPKTVRAMIESELGQDVYEVFAEFEDQPIASASIAQAHRARLKSGEQVVLKVQHTGIEKTFRVDLDILVGFAQLSERLPELRNYRPRETAAEFRRTLLRELDFGREERNIQQFTQQFAGDARIKIPRVYPELSTGRVLTMELIEGTKLIERDRLIAGGFDLEEIARRGAGLYMEMIFTHGLYHADPHPGNILVLEGDVIGLLDFGMVGRIDERLREDIEEMLMALANTDSVHLTSIITRLGQVPPELDHAALGGEVADFVSLYTGQRLDSFDLSGALKDLTEIIRRYQIILPAQMSLLIKTLMMLEGTIRLLDPKFSLIEVMKPFQRKLLWRRLSPGRQIRKMRRIYSELEHLAEALPRGILDILQQVQSGKFDIHLDHRGLEPSVNRLVLGMLASALFLGSSLLWGLNVEPLIYGVSLLGAAGCICSIGLGMRLLRAINKSGHLDRRK